MHDQQACCCTNLLNTHDPSAQALRAPSRPSGSARGPPGRPHRHRLGPPGWRVASQWVQVGLHTHLACTRWARTTTTTNMTQPTSWRGRRCRPQSRSHARCATRRAASTRPRPRTSNLPLAVPSGQRGGQHRPRPAWWRRARGRSPGLALGRSGRTRLPRPRTLPNRKTCRQGGDHRIHHADETTIRRAARCRNLLVTPGVARGLSPHFWFLGTPAPGDASEPPAGRTHRWDAFVAATSQPARGRRTPQLGAGPTQSWSPGPVPQQGDSAAHPTTQRHGTGFGSDFLHYRV